MHARLSTTWTQGRAGQSSLAPEDTVGGTAGAALEEKPLRKGCRKEGKQGTTPSIKSR